MIPIKFTRNTHEEILIEHLCSLEDEDRRLRFGGNTTNEFIAKYVKKSLGVKNSQWFGCIVNNKVVSACHAAIYNVEGEIGCSVNLDYRGKGLAQAMFDRAVTYFRVNGVSKVYMHCLTENNTMRHIAKKNSMTIVSCHGESNAAILIEPPTSLTAITDVYLDRMAICDMLFRSSAEMYESYVETFNYGKRKNSIE